MSVREEMDAQRDSAAARAWVAAQPLLNLAFPDTATMPGLGNLVDDGRWVGGIEAVWPPVYDEQRWTVTIGRLRGWLVQVAPMFYNDRLLLSPEKDFTGCYDHAWCYPKGGPAVFACALWQAHRDPQPAGFIKRATPNRPPGPHEGARGWTA